MRNLTKEKFERILQETSGVENYVATFKYNGKTYKKKDLQLIQRRKSAGSIFNYFFSKVRIELDEEVTLYDKAYLDNILYAEKE